MWAQTVKSEQQRDDCRDFSVAPMGHGMTKGSLSWQLHLVRTYLADVPTRCSSPWMKLRRMGPQLIVASRSLPSEVVKKENLYDREMVKFSNQCLWRYESRFKCHKYTNSTQTTHQLHAISTVWAHMWLSRITLSPWCHEFKNSCTSKFHPGTTNT